MSPSRSTYDPLPRNSTSLDLDSSSAEQFKDKPLPSRQHLIQRTLRRCASRACRPWPISIALAAFLLWQLTFNASYSLSTAPAFTPSPTDTVFIAANIVDGSLITGAWGKSLLELVESIGSERAFVSIYGGPTDALRQLESMLECESSVVSEVEQPLDMSTIPRTLLPTGEWKVKRIAYLAEVRNKVLEPLYKPDSKGGKPRKWDKILFVNDVYFEAEGALRLLWGTNVNERGESVYKAVCAADFVTSWKYYDTFATRDVEGYSIGVPLFPWFSAEGEAVTRNDVLAGKDAVRVRSCWGGMVAFKGEYFWARDGEQSLHDTPLSADLHPVAQNEPAASSSSQKGNEIAHNRKANNGLGMPQLPLRFRSEPEPFWDSSECCLIHADIIALSAKEPEPGTHGNAESWDTGIYMNPYVRTAYSKGAFGWIRFAKRWERLMSPLQRLLNSLAHMPRWNYRRSEKEGQVVPDRLWISVHSNMTEQESVHAAEREFGRRAQAGKGVSERGLEARGLDGRGLEGRATLGKVRGKEYWGSEGYYVDYKRTAKRGGYCGVRQLLVMKEAGGEGEGNWDNLLDRVPPVDV